MSASLAALRREVQLERELFRRRAQRELLPFIKYTKPKYFCSWHHRQVAGLIEHMAYGKTAREFLAWLGIEGQSLEALLKRQHEVTKLYAGMTRPEMLDEPLRNVQVWLSPRHGKSEIISRRTPAWWLGINPGMRIIGTSFGNKFAAQLNREIQRIIEDNPYKEVFPGTQLYGKNIQSASSGAYLKNSEIFEVVGGEGFYKSSGIGGDIMGRGCDLALVDDPFKSRKQAESPVERLTTLEWYNSTLYSRLEKDASRIIINTRWHASDLSGSTVEAAQADAEAEQYFCLVYPAILDCEPGPGDPRKQGEALWPEKYSVRKLAQIRASMGSYDFEALHQQRPSPKGGGVVAESWWQFYDVLPEGLTDFTISVDLSFKERGDFSAFQVWAAKGANRYLCDQYHGRMTFTQQVKALLALCRKWPVVQAKLIEDAANGAALVDMLRREVQGLIPIKATASKELRVDAVSPQIEAGNVFLPARRLSPWVDGFVGEFNAFPNGANDDQVDAASQALHYMRQQVIDFDFSVEGIHKQSQWL